MLIIRDAFLGVTRFDDFHEHLGISRNVLNHRLSHLVGAGVLERIPYCEHPPRFEYRLTAKGKDLWAVLTAMRQWGDRWEAPDGPPVELVHERCGHVAEIVSTCSACGEAVRARDMRAVAGPGAGDDPLIPARVAAPAQRVKKTT
jgi:DNA-binding HxlR family transcriptional regulator